MYPLNLNSKSLELHTNVCADTHQSKPPLLNLPLKKLPGNCIKNIKAAKREIPFEAILMCGSVICQTFKCSRSPLKSPALYLTWSVNIGLLANCVGPLISI